MHAFDSTGDALLDSVIGHDRGLPAAGTVVGGRFRLGRLLGEGGMSAVFLAHDERLARDVALKLLSPNIAHSREIVTRFVNEARMLARLDSEHIVRVLDAGVTDEQPPLPYMVLELLHGEDLRSECERGPVERVEQAVAWILQACEGLAVAHAEGVVHRDLKPENLFLARSADGSEVIKVLDFGIARSLALPSQLTQNGEGVGSPGYMSPEQLNDASTVDQRSDVWSLGVVLYELLAGVPPFHSHSTFELCAQILSGKPARLGRFRSDLPRGLAAVVHRCLAVDPEERFQDVADLAEALAEFAGEPGLRAARRIQQRLHALPESPLSDAQRVDVQAPTEPAIDEMTLGAVLQRRKRARTRRVASQVAGWAAVGGALLLLAHALAPSLPKSTDVLAEARGSVERAGVRLSDAARSVWDPDAEAPSK
jgi:serine/threonine-protein kinase